MSNTIIYPSIELFIYDLEESLGQDGDSIKENYRKFCRKIYGNLNDADFDIEYKKISELGTRSSGDPDYPTYLIGNRIEKLSSPLDGHYYPLKIGDTLALQLCYSGKLGAGGEPNYQKQDLEDNPFSKLKEETDKLISNSTSTIGQTRILWGRLAEDKSITEVTNIAKTCYNQIDNNLNWDEDFIGSGEYLNGNIFELYHIPDNFDISSKGMLDKLINESHVIIWLFPSDLSDKYIEEKVNSAYLDFMYLFQYRHKITRSYYQCQLLKKCLKENYIKIQPSIDKVRDLSQKLKDKKLRLGDLQDTLADNLINLSNYTTLINSLNIQKTTIETNLGNYKNRFKSMEEKYPSNKIAFFRIFVEGDVNVKKYENYLKMQLSTFNPGLKVLESLNSTLHGIIEIERTKSERALDTTIAIAGIGLALSSLTATAIVEQKPAPEDLWHINLVSTPVFLGSLIPTVVLSAFVFFILRMFKR